MFERDKNELRDLGIPLETGRVSQFDPTEGYRINRDAYALPAVELTADEAAAVAVATQLWESPELITATQGALLKLRAAGVDVDAGDAGIAITSTAGMPGLRGSEDVLGILLSAIDSGQAVQFPHRPVAQRALHHPHRRAVGRGHRPGPLVPRRPRPRPRRHPHLPAVPHRRRRDAHRPGRRGQAARRGRTCARSCDQRGRRDGRRGARPGSGSPTAAPPRCAAGPPWSARVTLGGRAGEEIAVDIGMSDRLAREIASYGAGCRRARAAVAARRRAGPAARPGRRGVAHDRRIDAAGPAAEHGAVLPGQPEDHLRRGRIRSRRQPSSSCATTSTSCGCAVCPATAPAT